MSRHRRLEEVSEVLLKEVREREKRPEKKRAHCKYDFGRFLVANTVLMIINTSFFATCFRSPQLELNMSAASNAPNHSVNMSSSTPSVINFKRMVTPPDVKRVLLEKKEKRKGGGMEVGTGRKVVLVLFSVLLFLSSGKFIHGGQDVGGGGTGVEEPVKAKPAASRVTLQVREEKRGAKRRADKDTRLERNLSLSRR